MNNYLIPANSKRGQLILGIFAPFDLWLLSIGVLISVFLLAFMPIDTLATTIIILAPGMISALLVVPIPYYHNTLTVITEIYEFNGVRYRKNTYYFCYEDNHVYKKIDEHKWGSIIQEHRQCEKLSIELTDANKRLHEILMPSLISYFRSQPADEISSCSDEKY